MMITLLQISAECDGKNVENQFTFDKVTSNSLVALFSTQVVHGPFFGPHFICGFV